MWEAFKAGHKQPLWTSAPDDKEGLALGAPAPTVRLSVTPSLPWPNLKHLLPLWLKSFQSSRYWPRLMWPPPTHSLWRTQKFVAGLHPQIPSEVRMTLTEYRKPFKGPRRCRIRITSAEWKWKDVRRETILSRILFWGAGRAGDWNQGPTLTRQALYH